jgi:ubiquinone/menaquinone biosynthesis C-methylase UbiE
MGGPVPNATVLEIGCGRGVGIELIIELFGAKSVLAFDLDDRMIKMARRRLSESENSVALWVGNTKCIPVYACRFDAVFTFGTLHHVVDWRGAIAEIYRVLKPGGRFFVEEILSKYIVHPVGRKLMRHPQNARFDMHQFHQALVNAGFHVVKSDQMFDLYGWFIADKPD